MTSAGESLAAHGEAGLWGGVWSWALGPCTPAPRVRGLCLCRHSGLVTSPRGEPPAPRQQASAPGTPAIPVQGSSMAFRPCIPTCCLWMQVLWAHRLSTPQTLHPLPEPPLAPPWSHSPHRPPHTQEPVLQARGPPPPGAGRPCFPALPLHYCPSLGDTQGQCSSYQRTWTLGQLPGNSQVLRLTMHLYRGTTGLASPLLWAGAPLELPTPPACETWCRDMGPGR